MFLPYYGIFSLYKLVTGSTKHLIQILPFHLTFKANLLLSFNWYQDQVLFFDRVNLQSDFTIDNSSSQNLVQQRVFMITHDKNVCV